MKIKVACFSHSSNVGGAELAFREMLECLGQYELFVFGPGQNFPWKDLLVNYVQCNLSWWFGPALNFKSKVKLLRSILKDVRFVIGCLMEKKIDVVIVNTIASPVAALAAKHCDIPVIWFIHEKGDDLPYRLQFGNRITKCLVGKLSDVVICNSYYILNHYANYIKLRKMVVAYQTVNGFILEDKKYINSSPLKIGIVGRLTNQKNQMFAIRALMPNEHLHMYFAGSCEGEYAEMTKNLCRVLNCMSSVSFCGVLTNMAEFYKKIDVLLACGHDEALGRSVIEAMKVGVPVIAPHDCGYAEIIDHSITGLLYKIDDENSLREEMQKLIDPSFRSSLGVKAKEVSNAKFNKVGFQKVLVGVVEDVICTRKI